MSSMYQQDLPPSGGYKPVQYKRNFPNFGIRPGLALLLVAGICGYGMKMVADYKHGQHLAKREKMWARFHILPLLAAEQERDDVRRVWSLDKQMKEVMKDDKDWEPPIKGDKFQIPSYFPPPTKKNEIKQFEYNIAY